MRGRLTGSRWAFLTLALWLFSSCGAGVAGVVASAGGSSSGSTPALDAFVVGNPKLSPVELVLDASQATRVALSFDAGQGEHPMLGLSGPGVAGNEVSLAAGPNPPIRWDFEGDLGGTEYKSGVHLLARRPGGDVLSGGDVTIGMGNDAPVIAVEDPAPEVDGVVPIQLQLSDTSGDAVAIRVEYDIQGDALGFLPARPGGLDAKDPTPEPALSGIVAPEDGTELVFFWDTDSDLAELERDVRLRFTPIDPVVDGVTQETGTFRVDNNAAPIVQLDSGPLILNPDERRGIPIPFRVIDEEGDLVEVIFQWRREGEEFASLDRDGDGRIENAEVDEILADKELRQEHHICTPYPHYAKGRVVPIDEDTVRLPELASSESWILASGIVGKTLELLRPSSIPAPITPTWRSNPLVSPIAALPVGDGLTALVLDMPGNGRLREIELATGNILREIATFGPGLPSAIAFERREKAVLVALDDAGTWRIERVELGSGTITELIVSDGTEPAPVRGIATLGTNAAVFTAGSSLFHLDYRDRLAPQFGRILTNLATPWGVAVDPLPPDRIYVSERDANRVLAIELDSHERLPVVVKTADMQPGALDAPEALALERQGSRMLIMTSTPGGGRQLLGLDLGATGGNFSFPIGPMAATDVSSVATGSAELRLLCLPTSNELLVSGGIEQQRVITAHSTSTQDVSVQLPLDPDPTPGKPWHIPEEPSLRANAQGITGRFVWHTGDVQGSSVLVRAMGRDNEFGPASDSAAPKRVRGGLEVDPVVLGGSATTNGPQSVALADLDGDGDQDLVSANAGSNNLTVFFQLSPGNFAATPLTLGGPGVTNTPGSVAASDLDSDGDQDLVAANSSGNNLTVFFQASPGSFPASPVVLGGLGVTDGPVSVAAADLDGDGYQDIVSANELGNNLTVFFQTSPGSFTDTPVVLGGIGVILSPASVVAADLDTDGDLDIVSAEPVGRKLTVFFQALSGSFSGSPLVLGGRLGGPIPRSVAAADLDGDGDQDLVAANSSSNNLTVFFQTSPGNFASPVVLGGSGTTDGPVSVAVADLDGDGDPEIVSANLISSNLTVFFQLSRGRFNSLPLALGEFSTTERPVSIAAADMDGDGDNDLISANVFGNTLTAFFQNSPASFPIAPVVLGGFPATDFPSSLHAADLNGDGVQDLIFSNKNHNNLTVFLQVSPGRFAFSPIVLGPANLTSSPVCVVAADLDGDGDQDIVSANAQRGITILFQSSPGGFASTPLSLGSIGADSPSSVATADLDDDGDQDLISAYTVTNNLAVFIQSSPGTFHVSPVFLGGPEMTRSPSSLATADIDTDGDQDIVSANTSGNNLTAFFQSSPGSFATPPLVLGGSGTTRSPSSVAAADIDGDGTQDIISANPSGNNLAVFFQLMPGTFATPPLALGGIGTTRNPGSVAAADMDADGDLDIGSANTTGNNLTVFFQLSPGRFSALPVVLGGSGTTDGPVWITLADLDADGEQDLVSANAGNDNDSLTIFWGGR